MPTCSKHRRHRAVLVLSVMLLSACGGGGGGATGSSGSPPGAEATPAPAATVPPMSQRDAVRLAAQASFGATEGLVTQMRTQSAAAWVQGQLQLPQSSHYTSGGGDAVHTNATGTSFCELAANQGDNCWRDWYSSQPLLWDFYRNAVTQPDQLRQRMAYALQQILVVSSLEVTGTYGLRRYQNALLDNALGNYRDVLRQVTLSPVMGDYLNGVNNDKAAPNENFARELLQLFSLGTCLLEADGSLKGGRCQPTYDNTVVRNYAYALTGWTYPAGGKSRWSCSPKGANCLYYGGDMAPLPTLHDGAERALLAGASKPAGSTPVQALDAVLDSLMAHPNMPPFIGRQLIQALVRSNPSPAYVSRVATAFRDGRFTSGGLSFGAGRPGDLAATAAAVLLDPEARGDAAPGAAGGRLREPVLMMTGVLRALNGQTDGDALGWWWGETLRQHVFRSPSVFNFYPPDYPVPGTRLTGGAFGIHNANTSLERLNYLNYLVNWGGSKPVAGVPGAVGTQVVLDAFDADAPDAAALVDRLSLLAHGEPLPAGPRAKVIDAVSWWTAKTDAKTWQRNRVRTAAYLVFAAPAYQVIR
ncbi:DUF1800 domain-containing protein [Pelomonas sp. P7]|uniref:DUF1800 domain-containing protein n=1 Tax=Pelomonas caseinilytica TaxID=2906763 RepID=A0ABS8XF67_9BURK|nr:DUF1800 family protein [Pelomonas sp. P7]MCE4539537.1 DUF1800 domain-containing protein [Pelomonas sp. P7]